MCVADGWDLTYSENHLSNLEMIEYFVENIMVFYHEIQIKLLGLQTH
jgi:hypothetical protein